MPDLSFPRYPASFYHRQAYFEKRFLLNKQSLLNASNFSSYNIKTISIFARLSHQDICIEGKKLVIQCTPSLHENNSTKYNDHWVYQKFSQFLHLPLNFLFYNLKSASMTNSFCSKCKIQGVTILLPKTNVRSTLHSSQEKPLALSLLSNFNPLIFLLQSILIPDCSCLIRAIPLMTNMTPLEIFRAFSEPFKLTMRKKNSILNVYYTESLHESEGNRVVWFNLCITPSAGKQIFNGLFSITWKLLIGWKRG